MDKYLLFGDVPVRARIYFYLLFYSVFISLRPITNTYTTIWERVLSSLTEAVLEDDDESNKFDDLNVEHLQLLLFLFHALALMQKKQLLLFTANCIIKVTFSIFFRFLQGIVLGLIISVSKGQIKPKAGLACHRFSRLIIRFWGTRKCFSKVTFSRPPKQIIRHKQEQY